MALPERRGDHPVDLPGAPAWSPRSSRRVRVALYSHDAQGLGHLRRNLAIAGALAASPIRPDILLLTGAPEAGAFERPPGCDVVSLPALSKGADGSYGARHLSAPLAEIIGLRSAVLFAAITAFAPDVLVVDKHPRGAFGELEAALDLLRVRGRARVVLGLRDVLDEPVRSRREWEAAASGSALQRWYDAVWVYGDPRVCDPLADLDLPASLRARVSYTGYLGRGRRAGRPAGAEPYVLGVVGGGSDGSRLALAFAAAELPAQARGVLVPGPHMPAAERDQVHAMAAARPALDVRDFDCGIERLLDRASAVVAMAGYNTVCEVLPRRTPLLVVPRVRPRSEQLVRARRMAQLGLLDVLHPDELSAVALGRWLHTALSTPPAAARSAAGIDLDGLPRIPRLLAKLVPHVPMEEPADVAV